MMNIDQATIYASLVLSSTRSTKVSLAGIRIGRYELSEHRQKLLDRVPTSGMYAVLEHNSLDMMDLAYLSAKTGDEFAILRSKSNDILFHGTPVACTFIGDLADGLRKHKYELVGHSHPGEDDPEASPNDRAVLKEIKQRSSCIISGRTGRITEYTSSLFD